SSAVSRYLLSFPTRRSSDLGCGLVSSSEWSLGYYTQFSENDGNPFVSFDCQENIGSWDPNDKRGFPKGYREEHLISENTDLEYRSEEHTSELQSRENLVCRL